MSDSAAPSPDVTVVVAAYNAAGFIDRAITSVLEQQGCSVEIVVVDDASSDNTADVVLRRATADNRVRLIGLPDNNGPSSARNAGIAAAFGRWVSVLDADDALVPGRLAYLLETAESLNLDIVADNFQLVDADANAVGEPALRVSEDVFLATPESFAENARPFAPETDWGLLKPVFRAGYLARTGLQYRTDIRHGEDFEIILDALCAGARYGIARRVGYLYTETQSGRSRTRFDFAGQVALSRERARRANGVGQHALAAALEKRAAALRKIDIQYRLATAVRTRNIGSLIKVLMTERPALITLISKLKEYMKRNKS